MPLKDRIQAQAPLRLDQYITFCLWDDDEGYYRRDAVFGAKGDFVTSPEISQIFGEIVGLWAINAWHEMGRPERFALLEMGAGRGVLMRDVLRVAKSRPEFADALALTILEKSSARRAEQSDAILDVYQGEIAFLDELQLPDWPLIAISNEFFDALPIRQFRQEGGGWLEAYVDANLKPIWRPCPHPPARLAPYLDAHGVVEINEGAVAIIKMLSAHLRQFGGQILTIDYGEFDGTGDTLQALQNHQQSDPFEQPGAADITAHIRFRDLAEAAELDADFMTQADFLAHFGGAERLAQLTEKNPALAEDLRKGYFRLTNPKEMGELFKVLIQKA